MITSEPVVNKIAEKVERIKLKRSLALFPLFLLREKQGGVLGAAPLKELYLWIAFRRRSPPNPFANKATDKR